MRTADKELVLATLNGDRTAFETLIRKYQNTVYGLIYSLVGNFADAQDLTQEAFIRAYLDLYQLKDHAKFASWLCQVARNICRMWNRSQKMDLVSLEHSIETHKNGVMEICDNYHDPAEIVDQQMILNAVNSLQESDRTVVTLFYMDGLTYQEVSEFLNVSVSAVESRLHRARKKLKGELLNMVQEAFEDNKLKEDFAERIIQSISTFNEINDMVLSRDGNYLWCATWGGLTKFDIRTESFTKYTVADGLRDNAVLRIAVDYEDRLWCSTVSGVCVFDSKNWTNYPDVPSGYVRFSGIEGDITVDRDGTIWLTANGWVQEGKTNAAVCKLEGDYWKVYPIDERLEGIGGVIYADRDGNIWYGARHGVSMLKDDQWTTHILERDDIRNHVFSILQDSKGNMWFGTTKGIWKFDSSKWTVYSSEEGIPDGAVRTLAEDKEGLIFAAKGNIIYSFDRERWVQNNKDDDLTYRIESIVVDNKNNKWLGVNPWGLFKFDGIELTTYNVTGTLPGSYVSDIMTDKEDNLWVATVMSGIAKYDGKAWQYYPSVQNIKLDTVSMFVDSAGNLWCGTPYGGLCRFDGKEWKIYRNEEQGTSIERQLYWIGSIAQDKGGNLWIAMAGMGVWRFDGSEWTQFTTKDGLDNDVVYAVSVDKNNMLWAGTRSGLCKYDGNSWVKITDENSPFDKHVFCISAGNDEDMWFGTWENGAYRYDGKSWSFFNIEGGLAGNYVRDIILDRNGYLWFGTESGLSCYDGKTWTSYGTKQGLASVAINSLTIDNKNVLWIGTVGGLSNMSL